MKLQDLYLKEGWRRVAGIAAVAGLGLAAAPAAAAAEQVVANASPGGSVAAAAGPEAIDPATAEQGHKLFNSYCARCHGLNMVNHGFAFDLRKFPLDDKARFVHSVTHGKRAMPAWGHLLEKKQIDLLWAYIASYPR